jgi:predicted dithiol-disulfide oxidoreductase (DUF899 family)
MTPLRATTSKSTPGTGEEANKMTESSSRPIGSRSGARPDSRGPGWFAFALEDGIVHHTYSRLAPDRGFVVPYYHRLLDRTPKGRVDEFRAWRHDEYEDAASA